jgi:hypothetical protein
VYTPFHPNSDSNLNHNHSFFNNRSQGQPLSQDRLYTKRVIVFLYEPLWAVTKHIADDIYYKTFSRLKKQCEGKSYDVM